MFQGTIKVFFSVLTSGGHCVEIQPSWISLTSRKVMIEQPLSSIINHPALAIIVPIRDTLTPPSAEFPAVLIEQHIKQGCK